VNRIRKLTLTGMAIGAMALALAVPHIAHADSYHPTVAVDPYQAASDAQLGFPTIWDCVTNVSIPTDPFTCTRAPEWITSQGRPLAAQPAVTNPDSIAYPDSCDNQGGVKIYQYLNLTGNCGRFTGDGDLILTGLHYPGGSGLYISSNMLSLSSFGSQGYGYIGCGNGDLFNFDSNSRYNDLNGPDRYGGHPVCDNDGSDLHIS